MRFIPCLFEHKTNEKIIESLDFVQIKKITAHPLTFADFQ